MEKKAFYLLLNVDAPGEIEAYLQEQKWLEPGESVRSVARAGEGNMNCTLRVVTERRSFILKQSRPWVEKYPEIPAPEGRVLTEAAFYRAVSHYTEIAERMPRLLAFDGQNFAIVLEDLGETADFTFLYNDAGDDLEPLPELCQWLAALHAASFDAEAKARLENRPMRLLNHEHLYDFPLRPDNGLALDDMVSGLQEAAGRLRGNAEYIEVVKALGKLYLENGPCLLHGDYYPGSWVRSLDDVWVIDPEFCFFGPAAFDVGILLAHLLLARRPHALVERALELYGSATLDRELALRFAGMEIMRRLIGVAQLPLEADLRGREALLQLSEQLVLRPASFKG